MKTRLDGLDVFAMMCHLQRRCLGSKLLNIYDGSTDGLVETNNKNNNNNTPVGDTFVLKFDTSSLPKNQKKKEFVLLQCGIRFHPILEEHDEEEQQHEEDDDTVEKKKTRRDSSTLPSSASSSYSLLSSFEKSQPSFFCVKLRKHLRGLRLEQIRQMGKLDRVICFSFLGQAGLFHLILELYAKGNLILTNDAYEIMALWRNHLYYPHPPPKKKNNNIKSTKQQSSSIQETSTTTTTTQTTTTTTTTPLEQSNNSESQVVQVKVGKVYPVTYATTASVNNDDYSEQDIGILGDNYVDWIRQQLVQLGEQQQQQAKNKKQQQITLKTLLLKPSSGVSHYGPALIEHVLCTLSLPPHQPLLLLQQNTCIPETEPIDTDPQRTLLVVAGFAIHQWELLRNALRSEASEVLRRLQLAVEEEIPGYLFYQRGDADDKMWLEFQPHLLKRLDPLPYIPTSNFAICVSRYFDQLETQKRHQRAMQIQHAATARLARIEQDQNDRIAALEKEIWSCQQQARAVEQNAPQVDQALLVINSALDSGMDWQQLEQLVKVEQEQNANPIALMIQELRLDRDEIILKLPIRDPDQDNNNDDDNNTPEIVAVHIRLQETAHANASRLFAQYRASKEKSGKTLQSVQKALQAAQRKQQKSSSHIVVKKAVVRSLTAWFQQFRWMITRDNYLVVAGKDAHQNELLVTRYLRPGDAYVHADVEGAPSCIVRAKQRSLPLSESALGEAGQFTLCHSSAWNSRIVTSAWWVEAHQVVTKVDTTSSTGGQPQKEVLRLGTFAIRGKKHYLPPTPLEMGLAILFRLNDKNQASMERHKNVDRRDFMLLQQQEQQQEQQNDDDNEQQQQPQANPKNNTESRQKNVPKNDNNLKESSNNHPQSAKLADQVHGNDSDNNVPNDDDDPKVPSDEEPETIPMAEDGENSVGGDDGGDDDDDCSASTQPMETNEAKKKKKQGLSVKERKLIKKYGSLEEAEQKLQQQQPKPAKKEEEVVVRSESSSVAEFNKRGKKSKLKRQKKKYADQDDEDRALALLLLQGGGGGGNVKKNGNNNNNKGKKNASATKKTKTEEQVEAATAAALMKSSKQVAESLPDVVRNQLAQCLPKDGDTETQQPSWEVINAHVLEQLVALQPLEAQLAAVTRFSDVVNSTSYNSAVEQWTMTLAGILRTIRKYGYAEPKKKNNNNNDDQKANNDENNNPLLQNEESEFLNENDEMADMQELAKLTGKPFPEDVLVCAVPVCAPYSSLSPQYYQFRIKLTPGTLKRGKAAKEGMQLLLSQLPRNNNNNNNDVYRQLILGVSEQDWVQTMLANVKFALGNNNTKRDKKK